MTDIEHEANKDELPPIEVPREALSADALSGIIESYVLREGTDYGASEVALETKVEQVKRQLDKRDVRIVFDPNTESVTLVTRAEWRRWHPES